MRLSALLVSLSLSSLAEHPWMVDAAHHAHGFVQKVKKEGLKKAASSSSPAAPKFDLLSRVKPQMQQFKLDAKLNWKDIKGKFK